jgi:retron-type reverse transcriptase
MNKVLQIYFGPKEIELAFRRAQAWSSSQVRDQVGLRSFGSQLQENSKALSEQLLSGKYTPKRGFKFYMPKSNDTFRTQTQLVAEDAIVFQAIANEFAKRSYSKLNAYVNQVFGSMLSDTAPMGVSLLSEKKTDFSFFADWRPLFKNFKNAVIKAIKSEDSIYKLETDITGFFDSIPHYNLFQVLRNEFQIEEELIAILSDCLNMWSGTRDGKTHGVGIPQGPTPSFLLANMFLYVLDKNLISEGVAYYRYMDDIKIYGYERKKMQGYLHYIDKYTKSRGLSINSKKTKISKLDPEKEDETIKSLRKMSFPSINTELILALYRKSKSENKESDDLPHLLSEIEEIRSSLNSMFESSNNSGLELKEGTIDIDLIHISVKFSETLKAIKAIDAKYEAPDDLIPFWIAGIKTFYWRASGLLCIFQNYPYNDGVKKHLVELYNHFDAYEWVRFYIITTLSFNFNFSDRELKDCFVHFLKNDPEALPRIALYRLLLVHLKDERLKEQIKALVNEDKSDHVQRVVKDFISNRNYIHFNDSTIHSVY